MDIHPAAKAMPEMSPQEFSELKADIERNGLLVPIEVLDGKVIDGRHRHRACDELGIEADYVDVDLPCSAAEYVWSLNGMRRHLTASQRAAIAVELLPPIEAEAKERQKRKPAESVPAKMPEQTGESRDKAASVVGVGSRYVSDAKKIKESSPETFEKIRNGEVTIGQAKNEVKNKEKLEELQRKSEQFVQDQPEWSIICGDCISTMSDGLEEQALARVCFTDPPYNIGIDYGQGKKADMLHPEAYVEWCRTWIELVRDNLTDDGSFWLLVSDEYAAELCLASIDAGFHRRSWIKWHEGFGVNCSNNFNRTTRHIFWFVVDPNRFVFHSSEVMTPSDRQLKYGDNRASEGGKILNDLWEVPRLTGTCSERIPSFPTQIPLTIADRIIRCSTDPGDLVLDPFNGSGTTGVAAIMNNRKYIGIDKSGEFVALSSKRLKGVEVRG